MNCSMPGFPVDQQLPNVVKFMPIGLMMPSNHIILYCLLLLLPSIFPSIRVFFNESVLHNSWPEYWSSSLNISPSIESSGLISFRMDEFDLLVVQGTLKSLLQHHSWKASILCSAFFIVQLSHPYMATGKTIALTTRTFVSKVMSLLFNMVLRFFHSFSPKEQVSFNFMAAIYIHTDFGVLENKVCHCFHYFLIYLPWSDGAGCHDLCLPNIEF